MGGFDAEYRELILQQLSTVFNAEWCYGAIGRHPAHSWFHGKGTIPYDSLINLAQDCSLAAKNKLFNKALRDDLKSFDRFSRARFELQILSRLLQSGIVPKRPKKEGRTADFLIQGEPDVFLEVKRVEESKDTIDAKQLTYALIRPAQDSVPMGINCKFMLGANLRLMLESRPGIIEAYKGLRQWQLDLQEQILIAAQKRDFQREIGIDGICTFILSEGVPGGSNGHLEGAQLVPQFEVSKICRNVIDNARQQIPAHEAGIILIHIEHLTQEVIEMVSEYLLSEDMPNVIMIILYHGVYVTEPEMHCWSIVNPRAYKDISHLPLVHVLSGKSP